MSAGEHWTRRQLLGACGAAGTMAAVPPLFAASKAIGLLATGAIDVHHHIAPPFYVEATLKRQLQIAGPLGPAVKGWTPARSVAIMDENGVATSMVSVSTPGIWTGDVTTSRSLARRCNEYAAQMVRDFPGRFGFMATLPLPDTEGSLAELSYALDVLKADGIGLLTSYDNRWLGDPAYDAVLDELDRRGAIVFVHPTTADCCVNLLPVVTSNFIEFPFDTTRAIMNLLYTGTFSRCQRLRFVFSHGGGALPMLQSRMKAAAQLPQFAGRLRNGFEGELRRHYYDTASASSAPSFAALSKLIPNSQILFGTDYPYGQPVPGSVSEMASLKLSRTQLQGIRRGNAAALFTRFRAA
jgi:predicted TIM-barrel fold metal-dependent hydrolase